MTVSLTHETAARISEMLCNMHAENENFDKDPELAAEIDSLCGMLKPAGEPLNPVTLSLCDALNDALSRLEGFMKTDCECDNTHKQNNTECCLCQYRRTLNEHPVLASACIIND